MQKIHNQLVLSFNLKGEKEKTFFPPLLCSDPVGTKHSEKLIKQPRRRVGLNRKVSFDPNEYPTASLCGLGSIKKTGGVENQPWLKKERGERGSRVTAIPGCLNYSAIISFSEWGRDRKTRRTEMLCVMQSGIWESSAAFVSWRPDIRIACSLDKPFLI